MGLKKSNNGEAGFQNKRKKRRRNVSEVDGIGDSKALRLFLFFFGGGKKMKALSSSSCFIRGIHRAKFPTGIRLLHARHHIESV